MEVSFAHLCDYATVSREGKLSVMGIFSRISTGQLPAQHHQAFLAFQLTASSFELGRPFEVEIRCMGPDGEELLKVEGKGMVGLKPGARPRPGDLHQFAQVVALKGLPLQNEGGHQIAIFLDGHLESTVRFDVALLRGPGQEPGAS